MSKSTFKVSIIGAGNIGSYHLQSLVSANLPLEIFVVDKSTRALNNARDISTCYSIKTNINFSKSINRLPYEIDVAIIATASKERLKIIESLLSNRKINHLIIEKVLFQQIQDYLIAENIFSNNNIKPWVNCWPRTIDYFKNLRNSIERREILQFNVYGSSWGLACNMIHMLDYLAFLTDKTNYSYGYVDIEKVAESKTSNDNRLRKGYYDFTGKIGGTFGKIPFTFISYDRSSIPPIIEIRTTKEVIIINLDSQLVTEFSVDNNWKQKNKKIKIPFQSQRTSMIVKQLIELGTCELTPYTISKELHLVMIKFLLDKFKNTKMVVGKKCLIT